LNTGSSSAQCSSVRSLEHDMPHTVRTKPATAVPTNRTHPVSLGRRCLRNSPRT
jgi:hypothetical protein